MNTNTYQHDIISLILCLTNTMFRFYSAHNIINEKSIQIEEMLATFCEFSRISFPYDIYKSSHVAV